MLSVPGARRHPPFTLSYMPPSQTTMISTWLCPSREWPLRCSVASARMCCTQWHTCLMHRESTAALGSAGDWEDEDAEATEEVAPKVAAPAAPVVVKEKHVRVAGCSWNWAPLPYTPCSPF